MSLSFRLGEAQVSVVADDHVVDYGDAFALVHILPCLDPCSSGRVAIRGRKSALPHQPERREPAASLSTRPGGAGRTTFEISEDRGQRFPDLRQAGLFVER